MSSPRKICQDTGQKVGHPTKALIITPRGCAIVKDFPWQLFKKTGHIEAYLLYKELNLAHDTEFSQELEDIEKKKPKGSKDHEE